jgi:hypothetical protein
MHQGPSKSHKIIYSLACSYSTHLKRYRLIWHSITLQKQGGDQSPPDKNSNFRNVLIQYLVLLCNISDFLNRCTYADDKLNHILFSDIFFSSSETPQIEMFTSAC